ncbi:MAG: F0F1 ATP synthase subunit epsilon [Holosporaceae bacterium]|nr:F0F1 ATP synthase subunit epsilon [Holosporaceae bacterium]
MKVGALDVKVLNLKEKLFDGEATKVLLPAIDGEMCILPHHVSIMTVLVPGTIKIFRAVSDRIISIKVTGGICSFSDNSAVFILQ